MALPYTLERPAERLGGAGSTPAKATTLGLEMKQSNQPPVTGKSAGASPVSPAMFRSVA